MPLVYFMEYIQKLILLEFKNIKELKEKVKAIAEADMAAAYQISDKMARKEAVDAVTDKAAAAILEENEEQDEAEVRELLHELESDVVRSRILAGEPRIDGRDPQMAGKDRASGHDGLQHHR